VCKVIVDAQSEVLLGVHMIGAYASEIIGTATTMVEAELRVSDIRDLVLPHPTVSEVVREAVWEI
jgi:dihydrolipoamide dehydrogenase